MTRTIVTWLLVALLAAAVIGGIVKGYEAWRGAVYEKGREKGAGEVRAQWDLDKIGRDRAQADAVALARREEQDKAAAAVQGEKDARDRAETRARQQDDAARRSSAAAGGLRGDIAALDDAARAAGAPSAAACPGLFAQQRDHAIRARALFNACVTEYRVLALDAGADGAALALRLDTAIGWIRATGAPGATELMNPP